MAFGSFSLAGAFTASAAAVGAPIASAAPVGARVAPLATRLTIVRNDTQTSTNWSGYVDQTTAGRKFTDVVGTWVEPKVTCTASSHSPYASFWVGIDGFSSSSVEQLGADSDCLGKIPVYYAWWEMYPEGSIGLAPSQYPVKPGDTLTAAVSVANGRFTLTLTSSEGWRFKTVRRGAPGLKRSSAEWIAEAPEVGRSTSSLAHFGSFRFSNCKAATNNGSATAISSGNRTEHRLDMVTNGGARMATPSLLSPKGNDFTMTWDRG